MSDPLERLRYHVTGAIERGEAVPIVEVPVKRYPEHNNDIGDWCPWSEEPRKGDDTRCPAGCRASDTGDENDDEDDDEDLAEGVTLTQGTLSTEAAPEGCAHLLLRIENTYELYDDVTTYAVATVPQPPDEDDENEYDEWKMTHIIDPFTGVGHTDGDSWYDVEVLESSAPEIVPVGHTWDWGY